MQLNETNIHKINWYKLHVTRNASCHYANITEKKEQLMISPSSGCSEGSISTSLQVSVSYWISKSLTLLWQIVIKPPVLQFNACVMLKDCPHAYLDRSPFKFFPYHKLIASRNFFLFSTKLYSEFGVVLMDFRLIRLNFSPSNILYLHLKYFAWHFQI